MDDLLDDSEGFDDLEAEMENMNMAAYTGSKDQSNPPKEEEKKEEQPKVEPEKPKHRTIRRCGNFDCAKNKENGFTEIDKGYMTVREKLGKGAFCKVKSVSCKVNRTKKDEVTGEETKVPLEQFLAAKVFNRKFLKGSKISVCDA